jgi:hypothetical protein
LIIAAYMSLGLLMEAPLLAWAERGRVRVASAVALAALAGAMALVAAAPNAPVLLLALALYGPASGVALAASEGTLVESQPEERERTLTRITFAGIVGDALVPSLLIAAATFGFGWRAVAALAAAFALALAGTHWRTRALDRPFVEAEDEDAPRADGAGGKGARRPPLRELTRVVRAHPALVGWLFVALVADLLDEVMVAFAAAHLAEFPHATAQQRLLAIGAWTLGDVAGIVALEAALRRVRPLRALRFACGGRRVGATGALAHAQHGRGRTRTRLPGRERDHLSPASEGARLRRAAGSARDGERDQRAAAARASRRAARTRGTRGRARHGGRDGRARARAGNGARGDAARTRAPSGLTKPRTRRVRGACAGDLALVHSRRGFVSAKIPLRFSSQIQACRVQRPKPTFACQLSSLPEKPSGCG